jgi:ribosomal protein S14
MAVTVLRVNREAEQRLRATIAKEFRRGIIKCGSEQAAARFLGISRQRFRKYLDKEMTPKSDVLLVAMANWGLKVSYEGIIFSVSSSRRAKPPIPEQLTLDYFDEPQVLHDHGHNVELRISRKRTDRLRFAVEVRLAG